MGRALCAGGWACACYRQVATDGTVKLADFGAAKRVAKYDPHRQRHGDGDGGGESGGGDVGGSPQQSARASMSASASGLGPETPAAGSDPGSLTGTPLWMAPEVVKEAVRGGGGGWRRADVWSVGCTVRASARDRKAPNTEALRSMNTHVCVIFFFEGVWFLRRGHGVRAMAPPPQRYGSSRLCCCCSCCCLSPAV